MNGSRRRVLPLLMVIVLLPAALVLSAALRASGPTAAQGGSDDTETSNIVWVVKDKKQRFSALFRHDTHATAGIPCAGCHDKIFKKETGQKFSMKDVTDGKFCGVCHQKSPAAGVKGSFAPVKNCTRCHSVLLNGA